MINQARRLLIVCGGIPHPSRGASLVLYYHYISALKAFGLDTLVVCLISPTESEDNKQAFIDRLGSDTFRIVYAHSQRIISPNFTGFTLDEAALDPIRDVVGTFEADAVVCFDLTSAWVVKALNVEGARLVWLGDLNFETSWYHGLYAAKENPLMYAKLPWTALKRQWWRTVYREVLNGFEQIVVSSASSVEKLTELGLSSQYLPYPWPNVPSPTDASAEWEQGLPTFLFFGTLAALGSRSAFHFLINRLYSEMVRHWGKEGFRVYIAGLRDLPAWAARAINKRPEFIFLGFVDDLDGLMAASDAIIAPIDVSVGNRSRIVTAMAKSALVIAHRNTALGNPSLVDGETCYLAVTPGEFSEAMVRAVAGGPDITEIIQRAKQSYEAEFAPDVASQMLIDSLSMAYNEWRLA